MARFLEGGEAFFIRSAEIETAFAPAMGGRMLTLRYRGRIDIVVPMEPHGFDILQWPRAGAYPLFPYHNRLAEAKVHVGGRTVELASHPAALPHTLHGPAHCRPWSVVTHEENRLVMLLDYDADTDWPWDYTAVQDFCVDGATLVATFSLTNKASGPMPAGIGWHPYFASTKQPATDAKFVWAHRDDYLPTGAREAVVDRATLERQPTAYLEEWEAAKVVCDAGAVTTMTASSPFDFLVVHRGDLSHVCVEPVTHVANAWNLNVNSLHFGARLLPPGDALEGTVSLKVSS